VTQTAATTDAVPGVSPDIYSTADFRAVAGIVYDTAGIVLEQGKAMLVYSRLAPLVRKAGSVTFSAYIACMRENPAELNRAVAALTTNHTFFYREAHHFEHLAQTVRPMLAEKARRGQPVRLWSAGCSSGEETWSMVMTLLGPDRAAGQALAKADVRVLASDLAPHAIERAEAALYPQRDVEPVPQPLRSGWTAARGENAIMDDTARAIVRFRILNLLREWPMKGRFDVIVCRNVMIYFDGPTKERLVERLTDQLAPDGTLFIGHSERVSGAAADRLALVGPTIYRRRNA